MPAVGILDWKRSKYQRSILHNSKSHETLQRIILKLIENIGRRKHQRGPPASKNGGGRAQPPRRAPWPCWPPGRPPVPIFCYMVSFTLEKITEKLSGRSAAVSRWNLGRTNLGLRRSCSAGETSLREGEIIAIVIIVDVSSRKGQYPSTSSPAPSPLKPQFISCIRSWSRNLRLVPVSCQQCWLLLVADASWFIRWKIICSDP